MEINTMTMSEKIGGIYDVLHRYRITIVAFVVALGLSAGAYWGYAVYTRKLQIAAHKDFAAAMKLYETPVKQDESGQFSSDEEKFIAAENAFRLGFEKNKGSSFAPIFLAFQAKTLIQLNKLPEALRVMKQAVSLMKSSAIKSFYEVSLVLMQLDSDDAREQEEGITRLRSIAYNTQHVAQGLALYYLGLFSWAQKNFSEAKNSWQQFMVKFGDLDGFEQQTAVIKDHLDLLLD